MNIIQLKTRDASRYIPRKQVLQCLPENNVNRNHGNRRLPYNYCYLARNGNTHKILLQSYELLFELVLNPQVAFELLSTPWDEPSIPVAETIVGKTVLENYKNLEQLSLYIPCYSFDVITSDIKSIRYRPPFPPAQYDYFHKDTTPKTLKLHLPKQSFPTPCTLCEHYPDHLAGLCTLLRRDKDNPMACPHNMKIHVPRRLL